MNPSDATFFLLLLVAMLPLTGLLLAATPFLMPKSEAFAVTVPAAEAHNPFILDCKRRYALIVGAATAGLTIAGVAAALSGDEGLVVGVMVVGVLLLCLGGYGLMLHFRSRVRVYKRDQGWRPCGARSSAAVAEDPARLPHAISLKWNLLYLPVMAVTFALCAALYPAMPDQIPMQMSFDGEISSWMPKGLGVFAFPLLFEAFVGGAIALAHVSIVRSKRWCEPGAPATSALAYGLFARAESVALVAAGLLVAASVGIAFPLAAAQMTSLDVIAAFVTAEALLVVVVSILISVVYGQSGSRLFARMGAADEMPADNDRFWKFGVFYCNPDDPSVFLPERFGIGWTINFARPGAWAFIAVFVVATAGFVWAMLALV